MNQRKTARDFVLVEFIDSNNEKCSLQESSAVGEGQIWLGTEGRIVAGPPWSEIKIEGALVNSRMHLSRDAVRGLLPYLQHFAATGYLPCK